MKRDRKSRVTPKNNTVLENLLKKKQQYLEQLSKETTRVVKIKETRQMPKIQALAKAKIDQQWPADRADNNMRQWGERIKLDVDKVKALAEKLRQKKKPEVTCIRYRPYQQ